MKLEVFGFIIWIVIVSCVLILLSHVQKSITPKVYYKITLHDSTFHIERDTGEFIDSVYYKDVPIMDSIFLNDNR